MGFKNSTREKELSASGLHLAEKPARAPQDFFSQDEYALEAFSTHGISYLIKPFELKDITQAMEKFFALQKTFQAASNQEMIADLKKMLIRQPAKYKTRLTIKTTKGMYLLVIADVCCLKTENGILYAYKADGNKLPLSDTISSMYEELKPTAFYRINRSEIIHMKFIEKIESYFNDRLAVFIKGQKEPMISSAARTADFRKWLDLL